MPANPKTSLDFMEGLFQDIPDLSASAEDFDKNLSPTVLEKKIENLQSSGHQKRYDTRFS